MVTTAFDRAFDLFGRDPSLVVGQGGAAGNGVYGGRRDTIEPHQLLLDSESSERREQLSHVQVDGIHLPSLVTDEGSRETTGVEARAS
jgi:hypothetical protein